MGFALANSRPFTIGRQKKVGPLICVRPPVFACTPQITITEQFLFHFRISEKATEIAPDFPIFLRLPKSLPKMPPKMVPK